MKRKNYISWKAYFMGLAILSAERSKDPSSQVGACIVSDAHKILSMGYNGTPIGISDEMIPWQREGSFLETKYAYVCHAELNAILNTTANIEGSTLYTTLFPCNECAKAIIQSGIKRVIYKEDKYADTESVIVSKKLFNMCHVVYEKYDTEGKNITIEI